MDNRAVVAIPFVAGYWPCACHLCLCLELLSGIKGRVEVGMEELRAVTVQRIALVEETAKVESGTCTAQISARQ